jgi:beta-lactamase regulating signal transducer with metallopeptidase domain
MIAAWMLYCTGVAFLIGAAADALGRVGRLAGWPTRWIWAGAMVATLALPLLARSRPSAFATVEIPLPPSSAVSARTSAGAVIARPLPPGAEHAFSWTDLDRPLTLLWGGLSLGLMVFGMAAALRLGRLCRVWRAVTVDGTPVLVSAALGPAVVGVVHARLVVPAWALELEPEQRALMLAHEREHLRAGDPKLLVTVAILLVFMPWNIALWWQWRRLRVAVEMDCDARVLQRHPDRERYGRLLLEVSERAAHSLLPVAAFHEPMSLLERRIRAIADGRPRQIFLHAVGAAGAAVLLIGAACEAPRPVAPTEISSESSGASLSGPGLASTVYDTATFAHLLPRIRRDYQALAQRYAGQEVTLWFVEDWRGVVVAEGVAEGPPGHAISSNAAASIVPGFDTVRASSISLVGYGTIAPGSPPMMWIRMRDPRAPPRDLSAIEQHPEMTILPWVREAIQRYFPEYIGHEPDRQVDLVFIADPAKRVLRTLRAVRTSSAVTGDVVHAWTQDLPATGIAKVTVTTFGRGFVSKRVRVIWVETRPGVRVPATTPQELPSDDVTRALMRGGVERYFPRYARGWAGKPVALQFWAQANGTVVKTAESTAGFGLRTEYQVLPSDARREPERPALWAQWGYPLGESRHDVRVDWYWVPGS